MGSTPRPITKAAQKKCPGPGCRTLTHGEYCPVCEERYKKKKNVRYAKPKDLKKMYNSPQWTAIKKAFKAKNPLCSECQKNGIVKPMYAVDHIVPHKGNWALFLDWDNLQSLCASCHNRKTATEDGGFGNRRKD